MKTPEHLAERLRRQWQNADHREARLLESGEWPLHLPIGKPSPQLVANSIETVRAHIDAWQAVTIGTVKWSPQTYRATAGALELPSAWHLQKPSDWVDACDRSEITAEYSAMSQLCRGTPPSDHALWVRQRYLWQNKPIEEILRAAKLADALSPGCAQGRPLRALSIEGIDSKFFERHRRLIIELLDRRHNGCVSEQGLESFLDATNDHDHWLLLSDLDGSLLPFSQQRVRASELASSRQIPGAKVIIVENEQVQHLLPKLPQTIAILGSGNNLSWLTSPALDGKPLAYWGDLDTWGLRLLAQARRQRPNLQALLMNHDIFQAQANDKAVNEPEHAQLPEHGLSTIETQLFILLAKLPKGRLEQEFLPQSTVHQALFHWSESTSI